MGGRAGGRERVGFKKLFLIGERTVRVMRARRDHGGSGS